MIVRAAEPGDLDAVLALEAEAFGEHERWSAASWRDELVGATRHTVVGVDGAVIAVATFSIATDTVDLNRIIVSAAHRGRRLADDLVRSGIDWARANGATRTLLEVRADNASALRLYARHGFGELASRADYYAPGADALVMEVTHV